MTADIRIARGIPLGQRARVAALYWEAFGGKLSPVLGPDARARDFLLRAIRDDHALTALAPDGQVLGVAGFKTPAGSFAGGAAGDMTRSYGLFGAAWRGAILRLLGGEVDNDRFLIDGICVASGQRGQGIGAALVEALCEEARARGYATIRLDVIDSNWRARALYERLGFHAIRTEGIGWLRFVFGFRAAVTMVRLL